MASNLDFPLRGPAVRIVSRCGPALSDVLQSKFGCVATIHGVDFEGGPHIPQRPSVVPEKRCAFKLRAGVQVSVWRADLTSFPQAEAVVNAANESLQHYGGLALALSTAGGSKIQQESDSIIKKKGPLSTGDAIITDAGRLPCKKIIHAVGPHVPPRPFQSDVHQAEPLLKKAIRSILDRVKENCLKTVAIPAISSGLFNFPLPLCADTIVRTVKDYYEHHQRHRPQEIFLVNNDEPTVKEMEKACHQHLAPVMSTNQSKATATKSSSYTKTPTATVQLGNVRLTLMLGKIEEQQTDVIVNTTFNKNLSSGQISRAILEKAGYGMQEEMYHASRSGYITVTKSYKLQCKQVYHTFCTEKGAHASQEILLRSVKECLWMATTCHKSISFPAIGTGGLSFSKKDVAQIMSDAVYDFAQKMPKTMDVYFVIFPSDKDKFEAFEERIRLLQQKPPHPNFLPAIEHRDNVHSSRAPFPLISLSGPAEDATYEAARWLDDLLSNTLDTVNIRNNFILHFGEEEHRQLSRLMEMGVSIKELNENGCAEIIVSGNVDECVVAGLQVEAMLCNIQREFVKEEESAAATLLMSKNSVSSERKTVESLSPEFLDRSIAFRKEGLQMLKMDKVENSTLEILFQFKTNQMGASIRQKMFQLIPLQFSEMVSHIGFHAEFAPPEDAAYGEGIYFADSVKKAMEVWKQPKARYLHFVEAEVLTGNSTPGKAGLILPPAVAGTDPRLYDSVSGPGVSVIFSGYQALPKYIITCKV